VQHIIDIKTQRMNGVESAEEVTKEVDAIVAYFQNNAKKSGAISVD
jgi:hypothetical protein